ncbi:DUF222 domain-containing protein [Ilumatobacter sp.]|uniref:HNH endonuclease signature motif containing protein n=1 Tax=Ilumatobacter sp. TaxID=1967498 RepID=UPI003C5DDFC0
MFSEVVDELVGLSATELVARIEENELERRRVDAEMAAALAVAKARSVHAVDGHRTMAAFCRATLNWSNTETSRRLGLARAVDDIAGLGDAWINGYIGVPQAQKLAMANSNRRVADQLADFAPTLLKHAEQMPYPDFVAVVDHFVARADEDGEHDDRDAAVEGRRARAVDVGGTLDLRASGGDGLVTAEIVAILERFTHAEYQKDIEARRAAHGELAGGFQLARTDRQRQFDALIAIFRAAATAGDVGTPADPLVNIVIDAATWGRMLLAAGLSTATDLDGRPIDPFTGLTNPAADGLLDDLTNADMRRCETTTGIALHPHDVMRAALAGHVRRAVVDSGRVVIDLGRRQRLFTGSARHAAKLLITRCEHAGCDLPADWCDIDHNDEWADDGGRTDQRNGRVLCRSNNNDKHEHRWRIKRGLNGSSYTVRADGTIILPVGARPPDFADELGGESCIDDFDDDSPEHIALLTSVTRNRVAELARRPAA